MQEEDNLTLVHCCTAFFSDVHAELLNRIPKCVMRGLLGLQAGASDPSPPGQFSGRPRSAAQDAGAAGARRVHQ